MELPTFWTFRGSLLLALPTVSYSVFFSHDYSCTRLALQPRTVSFNVRFSSQGMTNLGQPKLRSPPLAPASGRATIGRPAPGGLFDAGAGAQRMVRDATPSPPPHLDVALRLLPPEGVSMGHMAGVAASSRRSSPPYTPTPPTRTGRHGHTTRMAPPTIGRM